MTTTQEGDASERERFADASFDTNGADDSVMTKVSILEPDVDVSELAEALGAEEEDNGGVDLPSINDVSLPDASTDSDVVVEQLLRDQNDPR